MAGWEGGGDAVLGGIGVVLGWFKVGGRAGSDPGSWDLGIRGTGFGPVLGFGDSGVRM